MELYSIKDLDKLSGVKAHTIRVWERRYRIVKPQRTETNRRRYGDDDLRKIINVSILRRNGIKISEIAKYTPEQIEEKVSFISMSVFHSDTQIDSLVVAMTRRDEKAANDLLVRLIMNRGLEQTMETVVFPFMKRIGVMWHTGATDIGSEHFITNIFRQKLFAAIDNLPPSANPVRRKVLMFLPENELHEIGLLFFHYLVRKEGHDSLYLGQTTPLVSAIEVNRTWNADIIVTGTLTAETVEDEFPALVSKAFPKQKILLAGLLAHSAVKAKQKNILPLFSSDDLKALLR